MKLEICASNYQSALNAELGGADRIELCRDLYLDGLTPDLNTLSAVLEKLSIPVFVLIRPRPGDFVYNQQEFTEMLNTIELAKGLGCHGIVSGVLKKDDSIDNIRIKKLVEASSPLPFTFHRAFDGIIDHTKGIEILADIGVERVLTSLGFNSAVEAITRLKGLQQKVEDRLIVMPGGGVMPDHVTDFKKAGLHEIHSSARLRGISGDLSGANHEIVSNLQQIKTFRNLIDTING